jgi:YidC/Oxa1 family membrane protein insertase
MFFQLTGNYGVAIIIVSVILRILIAPTQHYQIISGKRLKEVEPLRKALEKRYKGDPKRLQEETSRLYKEHKVNPMASCLPLLVQIPIIWAFFTALRTFEYLGPANFLWIADLSQPDLWILPIIAGVTTYLQSKLTMPTGTDSTSQMMQIMMPLLIIWFSRSFAAGLALYWVVSNIVSILQQLIVPAGGRRIAPEEAKS